jgi:hypothetical protein
MQTKNNPKLKLIDEESFGKLNGLEGSKLGLEEATSLGLPKLVNSTGGT